MTIKDRANSDPSIANKRCAMGSPLYPVDRAEIDTPGSCHREDGEWFMTETERKRAVDEWRRTGKKNVVIDSPDLLHLVDPEVYL